MSFMNDSFLLESPSSKKLYQLIEDLPIFDFHCHLDAKVIYEDKPFNNIVDLWLDGDHYKWRLMRANGIPESKITGNADNEIKFEAWARTIGTAFGNPLFHFTHLELKNIFGVVEHLNENNWKEIYDHLNDCINEKKLSPRQLIKESNVDFIGTTDSPLDSLEWHKKLNEDKTFNTIVAPTFRPDSAFVHHSDFNHFVNALSELEEIEIKSYHDFVNGLEKRVKYFADCGCKASDISLDSISFCPTNKDVLDLILRKKLQNKKLTTLEISQWQTEILKSLCGLYKKYGFVAQIHFGAQRNNSSIYYEQVGVDSGFDSIGDQTDLAHGLNCFINYLQKEDKLPKMIWYNLNPNYNTIVANTLTNFQANEKKQRSILQFGSAWWFSDHKRGILDQMKTLGEQGMLANFVGMLTDSRSFLSYSRHDYFRRILSSLLGKWMDNGEIPNDLEFVGEVAKNIAYYNAKRFFEE